MTYTVTMHTCGGSMGEAVWYQESATLATAEEAAEVEEKCYALAEAAGKDGYGNELLFQVIVAEDPVSVDEAVEKFKNHYYLSGA